MNDHPAADQKPEPSLENTEQTPRGLTQQAVIGSGWSTLSTVTRQVLSFFGAATLAHLLGPEVYGIMGMAALVTVFLINFRDLGTAAAIIQRSHVTGAMLSSVFWLNVGFGFVLMAVVYGVAEPAAVFFHQPQLRSILQVLSISFLVTAAGAVQSALLSRNMAFGLLSIVDVTAAVFGYGVAILAALWGFGVWSLVFSNIINAVVTTALAWLFCGWRPSFLFSRSEVTSIMGFSLSLSGFGLVNYFNRNADNLIVGRKLGAIPLGYYQAAYNLMLYPIQNISSVIGQVLLPAFSRIQNDDERFRSAYIRSCMIIGVVTFPALAGMGIVADPLIHILLGPRWVTVIPILQVLVPVGIVQSVQTTVGHIYIAKGRTDWMFRWNLLVGVVLVTSFLFGVRFGPLGVALSYSASYLSIIMIPGFYIPFRLVGLHVRTFLWKLCPQLLITLAMVGVCLLWRRLLQAMSISEAGVDLLSTSVVGALSYVSLLLLVRPSVVLEIESVLEQSGGTIGQKCVVVMRWPSFLRQR